MARRPVSESYQSVCSRSSDIRTVGLEDADDGAPIFSLSRSSMDVVMATGPPHQRDPAWTTMDMRRSSSTNTHPEGQLVAFKQLPPCMWQHVNVTNSHHMPLTGQHRDVSASPVLSERWLANTPRWSQCSSSTLDTIVGRDGTSRPSSVAQETPFSAAPDSPVSTPMSPATEPSSLVSPLQTPDLLPEDLLASSPLTLSPGQQKDFFTPTPSPLVSPHQACTPSPRLTNSPNLLQLAGAEDDGSPGNHLGSFTFPSPILSSTSLAEGCDASDSGSLADDAALELHSPERLQILASARMSNALDSPSSLKSNSSTNQKESSTSHSFLELPWEPGQIGTDQSSRSPLVCSVSDSQLGKCCRCSMNTKESISRAPKSDVFREEGTMTSQPELVDVEVQTMTPTGSLWGLRRNLSNSNMDSPSILGSPPGSRLNLKSSAGSNSNLVSPSSSMFPISSEEEEEKCEDSETEVPSHNPERRRSCLKNQGEEGDQVRRSSMKQVQWDEDGMTWDIHGACPDPEDLSTAIQKHLEVLSNNQPVQCAAKKKKAPKPPIKSPSDPKNPSSVNTEADVECKREETPDRGRKMDKGRGAKMEEATGSDHRLSRAESDARTEEKEASSPPKSPSQGSTQNRKRSVIRSLRRPGWCGGSRKIDD